MIHDHQTAHEKGGIIVVAIIAQESGIDHLIITGGVIEGALDVEIMTEEIDTEFFHTFIHTWYVYPSQCLLVVQV